MFDPQRRYAAPGHTGSFGEQGSFIDPFELYGLDTDTAPKQFGPDDHFERREVPSNAWDGFALNQLDRKNLKDSNLSSVRGHWATNSPSLPPRLSEIGEWLSKVADQPTTVWWAAGQTGLHPDIQRRIQLHLQHSQKDVSSAIRLAWQYLFDFWEINIRGPRWDWYELKATIDKNGWDSRAVRKFVDITRPYLKVERHFFREPKPPQWKNDISVGDMLQLKVAYPEHINDANIPDEWLSYALRGLRENLEYALLLETERGNYWMHNISPIVPEDSPDVSFYGRTHGLSGSVIAFVSFFERLVKIDINAAKQEMNAWLVNGNTIFSLLRIWASGKSELVSAQNFGSVIATLSDDDFWNSYYQRDLLLVLSKRWPQLSEQTQREIEDRILHGASKFDRENEDEFQQRKAWETLNWFHWLAGKGCKLFLDLEVETKKLQHFAPKWKVEYSEKAVDSMESKSGWVGSETNPNILLQEPIQNILKKALEVRRVSENTFRVKKPFTGLSAKRPLKAFAALQAEAKQGKYPEWAWHTFLNHKARDNDRPKFSALIAERIARYSDDAVANFIFPISDWILNISEPLSTNCPESFDRIVSKVISVLRSCPPRSESAVVRGSKEPDWVMEAINAPAGKIAQALFNDPRSKDLVEGKGFSTNWLSYVNNLLSLSGNSRCYTLVLFAHNLNWLYTIDPVWTETNILSVLEENDEHDKNAVWSGFFQDAKVPNRKLYLKIKPHLLEYVKKREKSHNNGNVFAGIMLAGWGSNDNEAGDRYISNDEMRTVLLNGDEEFCLRILWQAENWSNSSDNDAVRKWAKRFPELLQDVWPRQKSMKTAKISVELFDLVFSNEKRFSELIEIVLPLLSSMDEDGLRHLYLDEPKEKIVRLNPEKTIEILQKILPEDVATWPYWIENMLNLIREANENLKSDERFLELKRKWDSR